MQIQERIQCAEKIVGEYHDLLGSDVNSLRLEASVNNVADIAATMKTLQDQGRELQIGIIGRVKAGKSSLLNILFFGGANVLPHAATPMTAALTTLEYGERPCMRVEFFTAEDLQTFRLLHEDHEKAIDAKEALFEERYRQGTSRQTAGCSPDPALDSQSKSKRRELARKDADKEDPARCAGWELWESIAKTGAHKQPPKDERIECRDIDDLQGRLADYVGAQGRRTPFTKCLHLELPFESLRGLRVVDTPGLNDPIVSREYRTQSMLHECDAVFIVSPAGQFLNQTDESLMERLSTREGVRTFYVIASQFDTQLFGHEYQRHAGNLPDVIQTQQASLARHAGNVFASWAETNPSLAILATDGGKALRISSSISHVLLETLPERWDENAQFVHHQLCTKYPDYFASAASSKEWLTRLSGIPQLKNDLVDVGENKTEIFKTRINDYLAGQEYACRTWIQALLKRAEERNREFESSDILTIEARIQQLANIASNGVDVANEVFSDQIEDRRLEIGRELKKRVEEQFKEATEESSRSKGETTERHQRRGVGAWFAKVLWGGGYEEVSVQTVETKGVRTAITDFRNVLIDDLNRYIAEKNKRWRDEISKAIIARLRDEMGDEHVRSDDIRRITKSILLGFSDLPAPELPDLPKELAATGTLRDSRVGPYMDEAEKYLDVLKEKGIGFSREIEGKLKNLKGEPVGARIFGGLRDEAESLKLQLQNKRLTAEKYVHLRNVLKDISV